MTRVLAFLDRYLFKPLTNKRNLVISSLLFLIIVIQFVILMPRDIELNETPDKRPGAQKARKKLGATKASIENPLGGEVFENSGGGQIIRGAHSVEVGEDGKGWELWAKTGVRPKESGEWKIETVKVRFFGSNGVTYNVTGKTGGVNPSTYDLWIKGNVETKSSNGYVFKTESVFYNSKLKKLFSKEEVEMTSPVDTEGSRFDLIGEDMHADLNTNEININRRVRANKKVHGERTAHITSNAARFSGSTNLAHFMGAVVIDVETMRITGPEAKFAYDSQRGALDSVMVAGGVRVTDSDKFATSGSLSVYFRDDKYVFKGSPRVVQNEDELIGDEIVFLRGGKQVQVINARAQVDPARVNETATPSPGRGTR